jgi:SAM-dependent methyltransferase
MKGKTMSSKEAGANSFLLYDKVVQLYESLYYSDQKLALEKPFLDQLLSLLPEEPKILDVGCGPARESIYLQEKGAKYIGVDASSKMLEIARLRNPAGEFHLCDIRRLCFPEGHFDAIISLDSLLHFSKHDFAKITAIPAYL